MDIWDVILVDGRRGLYMGDKHGILVEVAYGWNRPARSSAQWIVAAWKWISRPRRKVKTIGERFWVKTYLANTIGQATHRPVHQHRTLKTSGRIGWDSIMHELMNEEVMEGSGESRKRMGMRSY
jgi:hypothetical protein